MAERVRGQARAAGLAVPVVYETVPRQNGKTQRVVAQTPKSVPCCKDCGSTTRKLIYQGPRCTSCWRIEKKRRKLARRDQYQQRTFGITLEEGELVRIAQGGGCVCAPWTGYNGRTRALSTDHDHKTGVIRGKLCKHCNDLLGRVRDDPRYFELMAEYLRNPPAVRVLGERIAPEEG